MLQILYHKNKIEEGTETLSDGIKLEPENYILISQRGFYHYKIGNNELAIQDLEHAINLSKKNSFMFTLI